MIPLLLAVAALGVDGSDLDALAKSATGCERTAMARAAADEAKRHSSFVVESFREQQEIVAARRDLVARRQTIPAGEAEAAGLALADRQQALDDQRTLDRLKQDAFVYFRQLYLTQCKGRVD